MRMPESLDCEISMLGCRVGNKIGANTIYLKKRGTRFLANNRGRSKYGSDISYCGRIQQRVENRLHNFIPLYIDHPSVRESGHDYLTCHHGFAFEAENYEVSDRTKVPKKCRRSNIKRSSDCESSPFNLSLKEREDNW